MFHASPDGRLWIGETVCQRPAPANRVDGTGERRRLAFSIMSRFAATAASQIRSPFWHAPMRLIRYRHIIRQFTRREVLGRYRGSYMGIFWSFINPLLLLAIFTVVFKFIFHAKFTGNPREGSFDFALMLFAGLIVYNLFAECLGRAPSLILMNANYVTKVVFPLEILPVTVVLSAVLHLLISFVPLCLGVAFLRAWGQPTFVPHGLPSTIFAWPLLLPVILCWAMGVTYLLSALGVFLRDLNQAMLALTTILMYASAVFYRIEQVEDPVYQTIVRLNPIAFLCEQSRNLAVRGLPMDWHAYGGVLAVGIVFAGIGYGVFMGVKRSFADVV